MFRFTIRDVLWLTALVALGAWLAITSRRLASLEGGFKGLYREFQALERQHDMLLARYLSPPVGGEFLVLPPPSLAPLPSIQLNHGLMRLAAIPRRRQYLQTCTCLEPSSQFRRQTIAVESWSDQHHPLTDTTHLYTIAVRIPLAVRAYPNPQCLSY
jgi:hypothetical protein